MKKLSYIFMAVFMMLLTSCSLFSEKVDGGNTDSTKVLQIKSASDFKKITTSKNLKVELMNDIDFKNSELMLSINFNGEFNGNNHTLSNIKNYTINTVGNNKSYTSIFNELGSTATIKDLKLKSCNVDGNFSSMKYGGVFYCSILSGVNKGIISNVEFDNCSSILNGNKSYAGKTSEIALVSCENNGEIKNITAKNKCKIATDNGGSNRLTTEYSQLGGLCSINSGILSKSILNDTIISGFSIGGVVYNNKGTIKNIANVNQNIYSYLFDLSSTLKYVGGICAENDSEISNSYCFKSKVNVENGVTNAADTSLHCYIGGLIGYNSNLGSLTSSYYQGSIVCTSESAIKSTLGSHFSDKTIDITDAYIGGICGRNEVDLLSNFSDCYISGAGQGSLKTGVEKGNSFADLASTSIKFNNYENRNYCSSTTNYGDDYYSCKVDISTNNYSTTYFKNSSYTASKNWNEFLTFKGFLSNGNYSITKFYPILTSQIGYENDIDGVQINISTYDPIQTN